jgi:DNA-binding transcriptional LysR family regulator
MDQIQSIRLFATVVKEGGFSRAAEKLGVSKSAATRIVEALENRLGALLLHRSTRHVRLTEIGALYLSRTEHILAALDDLESRVSSVGAAPSGLLRISSPVDFGLAKLSWLLGKFISNFPAIQPIVTLTDSPVDFDSQLVDAAFITFNPTIDDRYVIHSVGAYDTVLVSSNRYLAFCGMELSPSIDKSGGYAACPISSEQYQTLTSKQPAALSACTTTRHPALIRRFVIAGMGSAMLPNYLVESDIADGTLVRLAPPHPLPSTEFALVHLKSRFVSAATQSFVDFAVESLRSSISIRNGGLQSR